MLNDEQVVGFLTGSTIPEWISSKYLLRPFTFLTFFTVASSPTDITSSFRDHVGLPADFLSTPFGQQLKPQIDQMYSGRVGASMPMGPGIGAGLLAGIAGQASGPAPLASASTGSQVGGKQATGQGSSSIAASTTSSLFIVTNPVSFSSALSAHPSLVVMLRSGGTKEPRPSTELKFEEMAKEEDESNKKEVEFLVVDADVGKGDEVSKDVCGVEVGELKEGPVFVLFRDCKKVSV